MYPDKYTGDREKAEKISKELNNLKDRINQIGGKYKKVRKYIKIIVNYEYINKNYSKL